MTKTIAWGAAGSLLLGTALLFSFQNCSAFRANDTQASSLVSTDPTDPIPALDDVVGPDIYVDPLNGNDEQKGSAEKPVKSLARAFILVAEQKQQQIDTKETRVLLRDTAWHSVTTPLKIDARMVPQDKGPVSIIAFPGESPVVSAGTQVTGWVAVPGTSIYKASTQGRNFRNFYMNGQILPRARYPKKGALNLLGEMRFSAQAAGPASILTPADPMLANLTQGSTSWAPAPNSTYLATTEAILPRTFAMSRLKLSPIVSAQGNQISLGLNLTDAYLDGCATTPGFCPEVKNLSISASAYYSTVLNVPGNQPFALEGNPAFVTGPGDWWIDTVANMIYVFAPTGITNVQDMNAKFFLAEGASSILRIGTDEEFIACTSESRVRNLTLSGITWTLAGSGRPPVAGYTGYTSSMYFSGIDKDGNFNFGWLRGAIEVGCGSEISFSNNIFSNLGGDGIRVFPNGVKVENTLVDSNVFSQIAGNGMSIYWPPQKNVTVTNNVILGVGHEYGAHGAAVSAESGLKVVQNYSQYTSASGLSVSTTSGEVNGNQILDASQDFYDFAGLYLNGSNPGYKLPFVTENSPRVVISGNTIRNVVRPPWMPAVLPNYFFGKALYLDFDAEGISVQNNLITGSALPFILNCETNNWVKNNRVEGPLLNLAGVGCGGAVPGGPSSTVDSALNGPNIVVTRPPVSVELARVLKKVGITAQP